MAKKGKDSITQLPLEIEAGKMTTPTPQPSVPQTRAEFPTKGERQEFYIPVSGFVWLYLEEVNVVDHPTFQRLGRVYQNGQTYLVYRGATHKRIEHALGVLHIVQKMIDALRHTHEKAQLKKTPCGEMLSSQEEHFVRLGALLHDIGHIAAGHTVEDELSLIGKHDGDGRLDLIFNNEEQLWIDSKKRTLRELINSEYAKYLPKPLSDQGITASHFVILMIRKDPEGVDKYQKEKDILTNNPDLRLSICRDMVGNTICADLLDYIHRDWYHIGKPRPVDDRIFQYMEIRSNKSQRVSSVLSPPRSHDDVFVISLGKRPKIRTDAISSILELLEWRYQLSEAVLFHRTKLAAAAMLDRALFALWAEKSEDIEKFLLPLSDEQMITECRKSAERQSLSSSATSKENALIALGLLNALEKRQLYTGLCTFTYDELPADVHARIRNIYGKSDGTDNYAPINRTKALRNLEEDFKLPPGSLAMYCPTAEMNAKIAEVKIAVGEEIDKFCDYEKKHNNQLSGGHLDAQQQRFCRLWRVHFFIDRTIKEKLNEQHGLILKLLRDTIEKLLLGYLHPDEDATQVTESIAISLSATPNSPWYGQTVLDEVKRAAYHKEKEEEESAAVYPSGHPTIRSCFG